MPVQSFAPQNSKNAGVLNTKFRFMPVLRKCGRVFFAIVFLVGLLTLGVWGYNRLFSESYDYDRANSGLGWGFERGSTDYSTPELLKSKVVPMGEEPASVAVAPGGVPAPAESIAKTYKTYNAYLSVVVKDLKEYKQRILRYINDKNGYVVTERLYVVKPQQPPVRPIYPWQKADYSNPLQNTATLPKDKIYTLYIVARIPAEYVQDFVDYAQNNVVDVVDLSLNTADITEQYEDLQRQLNLLETTYNRLLEIYNKAQDPKDLLAIQQRLLDVQRQIDSIKGRMQAIEKESKYARVTIKASTEKLALEYVPQNAWDLQTTIKLAIRALMSTLAVIVKAIIWIVVFSPLWLGTFLIVWFVVKKWRRSKKSK